MTDTCGLTSCEPFAKWDHDSQSWKTSEATSLWALTLSSLTLPAWGGLHDGELCEHPTPERLTSGPDFSSLPTPRTSDSNGAGGHGSGGPDLRTTISMLPTPRATDGPKGGPGQVNGRGVPDSLPAISALLPTPAVNDMGRGKTPEDWDAWTAKMQAAHGNGNGHGKSLEIEAQRLLPTPATANSKSTRAMTASTENGRRSGGGQSSPPGLEEMASILAGHWPDHMPPVDQLPPATVALLPTPTSQAAKHGELSPVEREGNRPQDRGNLWVVMPRLVGEITVPPSPDGSASSDGQLPGQLSLDGLAHPA